MLISLLQPAPETFNLFDDVLVLSEGNGSSIAYLLQASSLSMRCRRACVCFLRLAKVLYASEMLSHAGHVAKITAGFTRQQTMPLSRTFCRGCCSGMASALLSQCCVCAIGMGVMMQLEPL